VVIAGADHELLSSDLLETGKVLNFVGCGQLTARCDAESHEALVHNGCALSAASPISVKHGDSRFRSARAA
jgi:hypothetical protein